MTTAPAPDIAPRSAPASTPRHRPSLAPPSRAADSGFVLAGPSCRPDPATHAYRQDLADIALADQVIASHYAEPLARRLARATTLLDAPGGEEIGPLAAGESFAMLDNSLGWAWGYAGAERCVGYVAAEVIQPAT